MDNQNKNNDKVLNEDSKKEKRDYEKSDKPFSEGSGKDYQKDHKDIDKSEPGNPHLEKTFDAQNENDNENNETQTQGEKYGNNDNPDEQFSDENGEKGTGKDMNNREREGEKNQQREADKIQKTEDTKNDDLEIELNKKLP